ncbi:tumor necrosis factor receptor superfamily member 1A isoform X2 [Gouania willdenowi]|nr:tumor necrosis factor receptor superfamily member 1A isoform X2 [Gouania willdenowi]
MGCAIASLVTFLLLTCMSVHAVTVTPLEESEKQSCPHDDYRTDEGTCCDKCSPGFKLEEKCHFNGHRSKCVPCPPGQYNSEKNYSPKCRTCRRCKASNFEVEETPCARHQNTICRCVDGFYKYMIDSETYECRRCSQCGSDETERQKCTPNQNTVCDCKEKYYRVNNQCEPCNNCTADCKHHCLAPPVQNSRDPGTGNQHVINIIVGAVSVGVFMLLSVALITHFMTKRFTKKPKTPALQSAEVSPDVCEKFLIINEESSETSDVKEVALNALCKKETLNLPDCVPLEIKVSELIYIVLDLVPVAMVKRLVRSLGVTDTEIEQAELDYRPCREAHYQMLRLWAKGGLRPGSRGEMLHGQLFEELVDKLRKIHLEWAAVELETKYGVQ